MSNYSTKITLKLLTHAITLFASLLFLVSCASDTASRTSPPTAASNIPIRDGSQFPTLSPASTPTVAQSSVDQLVTALTAAGASVENNGFTEQGLFPGSVKLWHLTVNGIKVNVYEFANTADRQAMSAGISPTGYEFTVTTGDQAGSTHWDWEGIPRFWALDSLIVNLWNEDATVIDLLNKVIGPAFADGSLPYRPEPYSGAIAGIGQFGVSFQYDPYLTAGIQAQLIDTYTDTGGMDYMLLPQHIAFAFDNSYLDDKPFLHQGQLNLETLPRLVVYPADTYAAMQPLARTEIELLQHLLEEKPSIPGGTLPYLPLQNAAQVFHSQLAYLSFANGAGVRYVTAYSQGVGSITNSQVLYTFQGLTEDGGYYVAAFFPVTTSALLNTELVQDWEEFNANYSTYVADTRAILDDLAPNDFNPDLTLLDAVVSSLRVEPAMEITGLDTVAAVPDFGHRPPLGVYQVYDGEENLYHLYRVESDGRSNQVAQHPYPLLPAPDAAHAVYMDEDYRLWLVNLDNGSETRLAEDAELSWLVVWGDAQTLLVGVYLTESEEDGLSTGHVATLDIESGELEVIDEEYISLRRPAMASVGGSIAYDISALSAVEPNSRIYQPDVGSLPFDPSLFDGYEGGVPCNHFNPAWSPTGKQLAWLCGGQSGVRLVVFDLDRQTAVTIFSWQPAQFGALPPSPVWSNDGKMLAIEIWANNQEESGLWVFPTDGTLARLNVPTGRDPIWLNPSQLIYTNLDENMNGDNRLVDLDYGVTGVFDMPAGSRILLVPPF